MYDPSIYLRMQRNNIIQAAYSANRGSDYCLPRCPTFGRLFFDIEPLANRLTKHCHEIGQMVKGEGIYLGIWEPSDLEGVSLGKVFDIYAAPEKPQDSYSRPLETTFNRAVQHVAKLKNWFNHDGAHFESDAQIYTAIREGREKELENWFIPTIDILGGFSHLEDPKNVKFNPDNLYDYNEEGDFYDLYHREKIENCHMCSPSTFIMLTEKFFSCSQHIMEDSQDFVSMVDFNGGSIESVNKDRTTRNVLLVRAKLRTDSNENHVEENSEEPNWFIKALQMFPL